MLILVLILGVMVLALNLMFAYLLLISPKGQEVKRAVSGWPPFSSPKEKYKPLSRSDEDLWREERDRPEV